MKKAFTLIEMLITIAITTIILSISVMGLSDYRRESAFDEAVSQVYAEVLKARSLALAPNEEGVENYTLNFSGNTYTITQNDGTVEEIDSGTIDNRVTVSVIPNAPIIFYTEANGDLANVGGINLNSVTITVRDNNQPTRTSTITITRAGSVELE